MFQSSLMKQLIPLHEETYKLAAVLHTNPVDYALYGR